MSAKIAFTGQLGTIHAFDPDVIYNLAVDPLPKSFNKPMEVWNNNVESTWAIAHYCMNTNTRMVHFSSSEVYGTKPVGLLSETDLMLPTTPYAASKAACDNMLLSLHETYNLDVVTVRPFNTIGPRQNQGSYAGIIPLTINRINKGKAPVIYGTGKQTRDISYVTDVTSAATTVAALGASGECYNVCSGIETSIEWLINEICYHMGYEGQVEYRHKRCADVMRHQGDNTKIKTLGWQPSVAIRKSVARTVEWYKCGSK
jgi:UDP-glucose 4-epimerase